MEVNKILEVYIQKLEDAKRHAVENHLSCSHLKVQIAILKEDINYVNSIPEKITA